MPFPPTFASLRKKLVFVHVFCCTVQWILYYHIDDMFLLTLSPACQLNILSVIKQSFIFEAALTGDGNDATHRAAVRR